jgi:hypothetical protein
MGLFNSRLPKNNKFDYTPRYYDERKERMEAIKKKYENPERKLIEERIRGQFKRKTARGPVFSGVLLRFLLILAVLLLLTYVIFKYFGFL